MGRTRMLKEQYEKYSEELKVIQLKHYQELQGLARKYNSVEANIEDLAITVIKETNRVHRECDSYEITIIGDTVYVDQIDYNGDVCSCNKLNWEELDAQAP